MEFMARLRMLVSGSAQDVTLPVATNRSNQSSEFSRLLHREASPHPLKKTELYLHIPIEAPFKYRLAFHQKVNLVTERRMNKLLMVGLNLISLTSNVRRVRNYWRTICKSRPE